MQTLSRGRNELGFSLLEFLAIMFLIGMLACIGGSFFWLNRDHGLDRQGAAQIETAIIQCRNQSWLGEDDPSKRTFVPKKVTLPVGAQYVTQLSDGEFPGNVPPIIGPEEETVFEAQTGRILGKKWGMVIIKDNRTGRMQAVVIPFVPGPLRRYVKHPGAQQFEPMTNYVY